MLKTIKLTQVTIVAVVLPMIYFLACGLPIKKSRRVYTVATVTEPAVKKVERGLDYYITEIEYPTDSTHVLRGTMSIDGKTTASSKLCKGEKFVLVYDKNNPSYYIVYDDQPVFLDSEPVIETVGTIEKVYPLVTYAGVDYSYPVKVQGHNKHTLEVRYTKFQGIGTMSGEKSRRRQYPDLKQGKKYLVKYSVVDAHRAVIYLNQEIK